MVAAAREACGEGQGRPSLLAVTVLTSLDAGAWRAVVGPGGQGVEEAVRALAGSAVKAGADGIVCSAREAGAVRRAVGPDALVVVPGIRPRWSVSDHAGQARTATPAEAIEAGATHVVIGRAVTRAADPKDALRRVREEVGGALERRVD